jgi:hypothetical protein
MASQKVRHGYISTRPIALAERPVAFVIRRIWLGQTPRVGDAVALPKQPIPIAIRASKHFSTVEASSRSMPRNPFDARLTRTHAGPSIAPSTSTQISRFGAPR